MIAAVVLNGVTFFFFFASVLIDRRSGFFLKLPHRMNLRGVTLNRFFYASAVLEPYVVSDHFVGLRSSLKS